MLCRTLQSIERGRLMALSVKGCIRETTARQVSGVERVKEDAHISYSCECICPCEKHSTPLHSVGSICGSPEEHSCDRIWWDSEYLRNGISCMRASAHVRSHPGKALRSLKPKFVMIVGKNPWMPASAVFPAKNMAPAA